MDEILDELIFNQDPFEGNFTKESLSQENIEEEKDIYEKIKNILKIKELKKKMELLHYLDYIISIIKKRIKLKN